MPAVLRERLGLPIAQIGTWQTATGEWVCTAEQLADAVTAQHDPAFRAPVVKLGHTDPRFTDGEVCGDGQPAVGRLTNLRLSDDGRQLLADWVGIPAPLDDIADSAYPSRSIECFLDVRTGTGGRYAMVVTGLALLGATPPAIESLGDLADLYGVPSGVADYVAASRVAASIPQEGPMPVRALGHVVASASIDELSRAAEEWACDNPDMGGDGCDCWVRDIGTDWIVWSCWMPGGDSVLWRASWSESNGTFTFGTPERVRPTYEPVPDTSGQAMAASALPGVTHDVSLCRVRRESPDALRSARGRDVTASSAHPSGEHVPISPALAAELGVPEDADDATVLEAIAKLRAPEPPAPVEPQQTTLEGGTTDTPPVDVEALVAAAVQRATQPLLGQIESLSGHVAASRAREAADEKNRVIGDALTAGKITPASREQWEKDYDAAPAVVTSILAKLARGTAVPVSAAGHSGGEVTGPDAEADALYAQIYGTGSDV